MAGRYSLSLEQVEADIRLCEALLAKDNLSGKPPEAEPDAAKPPPTPSQPSPQQEGQTDNSPKVLSRDSSDSTSLMGRGGSLGSRLPESRRQEILARLAVDQERRRAKLEAGFADLGPSPAQPSPSPQPKPPKPSTQYSLVELAASPNLSSSLTDSDPKPRISPSLSSGSNPSVNSRVPSNPIDGGRISPLEPMDEDLGPRVGPLPQPSPAPKEPPRTPVLSPGSGRDSLSPAGFSGGRGSLLTPSSEEGGGWENLEALGRKRLSEILRSADEPSTRNQSLIRQSSFAEPSDSSQAQPCSRRSSLGTAYQTPRRASNGPSLVSPASSAGTPYSRRSSNASREIFYASSLMTKPQEEPPKPKSETSKPEAVGPREEEPRAKPTPVGPRPRSAGGKKQSKKGFLGEVKSENAIGIKKGKQAKRSSSAPRERPKATVPEPFQFRGIKSYRHRRDVVARRVAEELQQMCPFEPQINDGANASYLKAHQQAGQHRVAQLARPKTADYAKYAKLKEQREQEVLEQCPFQPALTRNSELLGRQSGRVEDRLHFDWQERALEKERIRRAVEQAELQQYSFQPQGNGDSEFLDPSYRPIQERVADIQRQRSASLMKAKVAAELAEGATFVPKVDSMSQRIFRESGVENIDVADRLTTLWISQSVNKKLRKMEEIENATTAGCTFAPAINPNTEKIMAESAQFSGPNRDFLTRQHNFAEKVKAKRAQVEASLLSECTFAPDIGNAESILVLSQQGRHLGESPMEKIERLAFKDKQRMAAIRAIKAEQYYGQFRFQPEINEISKIVGRAPSVEELHKNERAKQSIEELRRAAEEVLRQQCPFKPVTTTATIPPPPDRVTIDRHNPELTLRKIEIQQKEREVRLEAARLDREEEEMRGCTFAPEINKGPVRSFTQGPIIVRGLGRYLELQESAKRQKKEQEERERKVFFTQVDSTPIPRSYTIPKPFNLQTQNLTRRTELQQQLETQQKAECTFRPQTNVAVRSSLVHKALSHTQGLAPNNSHSLLTRPQSSNKGDIGSASRIEPRRKSFGDAVSADGQGAGLSRMHATARLTKSTDGVALRDAQNGFPPSKHALTL